MLPGALLQTCDSGEVALRAEQSYTRTLSARQCLNTLVRDFFWRTKKRKKQNTMKKEGDCSWLQESGRIKWEKERWTKKKTRKQIPQSVLLPQLSSLSGLSPGKGQWCAWHEISQPLSTCTLCPFFNPPAQRDWAVHFAESSSFSYKPGNFHFGSYFLYFSILFWLHHIIGCFG